VTLAFSTFLSSGANKWVACVELNDTGAFSNLPDESDKLSFRKHGIDFYPESNLTDLTGLLSEHYDVLVLDFGVLNQNTYPAFKRCDLCIVLGYMSPWNSKSYWNWVANIFHNINNEHKEIILLGNLSSQGEIKQFRRRFGIHAIPVPFVENPFQLSSNHWKFIERALERNPYTTKLLFSGR